jgi:hypothetical protein
VIDIPVVYLDFIDDRLLEYLGQDDKVHGPPLSLARQQGSWTLYHGEGRSALEGASMRSASVVSNGLSRERVVAIFGQLVRALWPRRLPRGRA